MSEFGSPIPISDAQARAIEEAFKTLHATGGAVWEIVGVPLDDLVGLLGGNWIKARRAENLARLFAEAHARLKKDGIKVEPASLSIGLPILEAAADESREELQDLWAALLAAAADPSRSKSFRNEFMDIIKRMDPMDAVILKAAHEAGGHIDGNMRNALSSKFQLGRDAVDVSISNLNKLNLLMEAPPRMHVTPLGREFLRTLKI